MHCTRASSFNTGGEGTCYTDKDSIDSVVGDSLSDMNEATSPTQMDEQNVVVDKTKRNDTKKRKSSNSSQKRCKIPNDNKPNESYISIIANAILTSDEKRLVLSDIYKYVMEKYPYFHSDEKSWRNSIRHNLSLNDCFIKDGRSTVGKGQYWAIHPENVDEFSKGDFRRRRAKRKNRKKTFCGDGGKVHLPPLRCKKTTSSDYHNGTYINLTPYTKGLVSTYPYLKEKNSIVSNIVCCQLQPRIDTRYMSPFAGDMSSISHMKLQCDSDTKQKKSTSFTIDSILERKEPVMDKMLGRNEPQLRDNLLARSEHAISIDLDHKGHTNNKLPFVRDSFLYMNQREAVDDGSFYHYNATTYLNYIF